MNMKRIVYACVVAAILLLSCVSSAPLDEQLPDTTGLFFGKRAHPNMNGLLFGRRSYSSVADQLPDTTGLFFGKRTHPNMNGLLFGKRGAEDNEVIEQQCRQVQSVCEKFGYGGNK